MIKKIAILTNGGDAPGLNAVIRAIVKTAEKHNIEAYGYIEGYKGVLENNYIKLSSKDNLKGILQKGGTIIGSSNSVNLFNLKSLDKDGNIIYKDMSDYCVENIKNAGFDCIFALGGDGTLKSARDFSKKGIKMIGIPKTIDNDVAHTDITFGFQTALETATDALDKLQTTGESHRRIMVLEVMGRYAGWIALYSAISGGADACLIPEIRYDIEKVAKDIIYKKELHNKGYAIVVVSEGAIEKDGEMLVKGFKHVGNGLDNITLGGSGEYVAKRLEELTHIPARSTTLGYVQRGGSPVAMDRVLSSLYGTKAMEYAIDGIFNILVVQKDGHITYVSLEDVVGQNTEIGAVSGNTKKSNIRKIPKDNEILKTARNLGISFGD
ncbi:MAG: 6-phosphofructokinase [Clostridium sp.]